MPNNVGNVVVDGATSGTTVTASTINVLATQALVSFEVSAVRANLRGIKATGASGGTIFYPGDIWQIQGNNYHDALGLFTITAITDGATGRAVLELFDGFDRA